MAEILRNRRQIWPCESARFSLCNRTADPSYQVSGGAEYGCSKSYGNCVRETGLDSIEGAKDLAILRWNARAGRDAFAGRMLRPAAQHTRGRHADWRGRRCRWRRAGWVRSRFSSRRRRDWRPGRCRSWLSDRQFRCRTRSIGTAGTATATATKFAAAAPKRRQFKRARENCQAASLPSGAMQPVSFRPPKL